MSIVPAVVEAAVHRELVRAGVWGKQLGADYSALQELRGLGDYGVTEHVSEEDARTAVGLAEGILRAVARLHPEAFAVAPAGDGRETERDVVKTSADSARRQRTYDDNWRTWARAGLRYAGVVR
jgi:hypothetical protein